MVTIIINNGISDNLKITLENIYNTQRNILDKIHIKVINNELDNANNIIIEKYAQKMDVVNVCDRYDNQWKMYNKMLKEVTTEYVTFIESGAIYSRNVFKKVFYELNNNIDYLSLGLFIESIEFEKKFVEEKSKKIKIDLEEMPWEIPLYMDNFVFKVSYIKDMRFDEELKFDAETMFMFSLLSINPQYYVLMSSKEKKYMQHNKKLISNIYATKYSTDKSWYIESIDNCLLKIVNMHKQKYNRIPKYIQYLLMYEMKWKYTHNWNARNQHIFDDNIDEIIDYTKKVLDYVDLDIILDNEKKEIISTSKILAELFIRIKQGQDYKKHFVMWLDRVLYCTDENAIAVMNTQQINIDIIEFEDNKLIIEAYFDTVIPKSAYELMCKCNSKDVEVKEVYRYSHTKYFGQSVSRNYTFRIEYPVEKLSEKSVFKFQCNINGAIRTLKMRTRRYTSKLTSAIDNAYYMEKGLCLQFSQLRDELLITKVNKTTRVVKELKFLKSIFIGKNASEKMFAMRLLYWITRPYFAKKNIWITYDKLYKGGDCGEYIHRYASKQKDGVKSVYVIMKNSQDAKRLKKEKIKAYYCATFAQRLYFLNASVVLATHSGTHTFNAFSNDAIPYFQDLLKATNVCIQHGLTVQQLAQEQNYVFNNTKRYYCASKYEIENLSKPIYGYYDKSILKLTGIPRYDGLINNDKRQILITPTWRSYIAMPAMMGKTRPYNPDFKNTEYFKIYSSLLKDERLLKTAKETGYKLIYLLHPVITAQIRDFEKSDEVEYVTADTINYEKILTESSLMLTDYSGVQFDFAYMRKPVVYYHPPKLPPHYKEGGFFYDTMGFGEICTEHKELVDVLCKYMKNECKVTDKYRERQDDFFAFSDNNSCERIYNDILEMQKLVKNT